MQTRSQAKAAVSFPMSSPHISPHPSPKKEKTPIIESCSPLVEEELPELPIADIEDSVPPLPYDKLLTTVKSLGKSSSKPESVGKLREPETFTSKDPKRLKNFLLQCKLYFRNMPETFRDDSTKINFTLSYLQDVALEWFEPGISGKTEVIPDWIDDWDLFIKEL